MVGLVVVAVVVEVGDVSGGDGVVALVVEQVSGG